ncbi:MAG: type I polyketide synthase, partial [Deltaproteobacteria bacterium]|nr:type I polyketide synthase [Deltaproteobacteria bacterium]
FWDLLEAGRSAVREIPADRWPLERYYDATPATPGKTYNRHAGLLDSIDTFDPAFFGISPREAESLDPQQRMLLETSWEALEDAAIDPRRLLDTATGVFVGIGGSEYGYRFGALETGGEADPYSGTGNESSFAAGRVAYVLGLRGPALSINTACSSSLVAVHQAVQALRAGECDLALAGGANAIVSPEITVQMAQLRALSPDGRCATFDASANGYVRGEGCGMIALRRLSDAVARGDRIHAVVRGSAVNHDGRSSGLTVPNGAAQQSVIRSALAAGGVDPLEVDYVECHGTGTPLGDPIEVRALGEVYGKNREKPLWIGSVKTNVGHLEAGAGMAGLLKAVLALKHRAVPAHLNLKTPNPALPLADFHLAIPTALTPWPSDDRRLAGVSSFGISGTNAHVVLEEAPADERAATVSARPLHLLAVSGRTEAGARAAAEGLAVALEGGVDLADAAYTANTGRANLEHRRVALGAGRDALVAALRSDDAPISGVAAEPPRLVFLCTGAGPQAVNMGKALYDSEPVFRAAMDQAFAALDPWLDRPLAGVIYPAAPEGPGSAEGTALEAASPIDNLAFTQPAMFAIEYAFSELWASWGVRPDAVIGHSTGQYVAAVLAGVFSLADGARLVTARSRLMSEEPEIGEMVAIFASEDRVRAALGGQVSIAAINSAEEVVISGLREPVLAIAARFEADGVEIRRLRISHAAHSPLMDPVLDRFEAICREVTMHPPRIPFVENVRGEVASDEITTPRYWREHMRQGVMFHAGMRTLAWLGFRHFLEIGNHPILCGNGARSLPDVTAHFFPSIRRKSPEWPQLLETAGRLWTHGVDLDWAGFHAHAPGRRVTLPTYPFQRTRFWIDRKDGAATARDVGAEWTYERAWRPSPAVPSAESRPWVIVRDAGGVAEKLASRLGNARVIREVSELAEESARVVSLVSLDAPAPGSDPIAAAKRATETTLHLLQRAARSNGRIALAVV